MGNTNSIIKINFESVQRAIASGNAYIINTLRAANQHCLILNTLSIEEEVTILNNNISKNKELPIIVYGENACDDTVDKKCQQLLGLGFKNIYVYPGGLFEWLILQDIYGDDEFKTSGKCKDLLEYKNCLSDGYKINQCTPNRLSLLT